MTEHEKAVKNIQSKGVDAFEENGTVYIYSNEIPFEIAEFEIKYQAKEYDEDN